MITLAPCLNDTHTSNGKETCNASSKRWGIYKFWMTTSLCKTGCSYVLHLPISLRKESISMANLTYVILSFPFISRSLHNVSFPVCTAVCASVGKVHTGQRAWQCVRTCTSGSPYPVNVSVNVLCNVIVDDGPDGRDVQTTSYIRERGGEDGSVLCPNRALLTHQACQAHHMYHETNTAESLWWLGVAN